MPVGKGRKIAHVAGYIGSRFGGEPRVVWALSRESAKWGFDVSVWATGTAADGADVESRGLASNVYRPGRPKQWFRAPSLLHDLSGVIDEMDMLHLHSVWTHPLQGAARLARRAGVPYLLTAHGVLQPWRLHRKRLKKSLYLSLIGRRMLSGAACLHATTRSEAEGFRGAGYQGPIAVVPNGVDVPDCDVARLREEADAFWPVLRNRRVVLFLSRFSPEKGLDLLLPVFRDLAMRPAYDDVILVLAGSGHRSCVKKVTDMAKELGVTDRVVMPGFVQGRQKAMLLCRTDVYTLPSYSEGFSVSVLEALALGVPVLITTGCDFPEVQEVGAGLCCSPARDDLARGFVSLLDMPQAEVDEFRRRGRALVRDKYTWAAIAGKLMTVYDCILSGRPVPRDPAPMGSVARCS